MPTIAEKIIQALESSGPLDDEILATRFGIVRQSIKQTARHLESYGVIRRYMGPDGKIVSALVRQPSTTTAASDPVRLQSPDSDDLTADDVKTALHDYLKAQGYAVDVAWGEARGFNIRARRPGHRLVLNAQGQARPPRPEQVNYFLGGLGELLQRMDDPEATYGLAFPDHRLSRDLVNCLPGLVRQRLGLVVYFVSGDGDTFAVSEDHP